MTREAECNKEGRIRHTCQTCNYEYEESIKAKEHKFWDKDLEDGTRIRSCQNCELSFITTDPVKYECEHEYTEAEKVAATQTQTGYIIYGAQCGKKMKQLMKLGASKKTYTHKKLKKAKYYKYMVVAYKKENGKQIPIATSTSVHTATSGGKYASPTKVTVKAKTITLNKGKSKNIKASYKLPKGKKTKTHIAKFRYESTNKKVVTVSKKGKLKAKKKGTAYIYVYAQNGVFAKIKVKVK